MSRPVAIVGVGFTPFQPTSPHLSYRELGYEAAVKAYEDAGVEASEIESLVCATEDFIEGTSITDEYCPDQIGGVGKPVHTIAGDGIQGLASAVMLIRAGLFDLVAVEAHSKISNIDHLDNILTYAMDPFYQRVIGLSPSALAALEMRAYLERSGKTPSDCAAVASKNRAKALLNPLASNAGKVSSKEVLATPEIASPLHQGEVAPHADGAIVLVLASEKRAGKRAVWIQGISWASDTYGLESREWGSSRYASLAAKKTYRMAGLQDPSKEIDLAEVDDTYAFKELQHLEAIGLDGKKNRVAVNTSGGSIGEGNLGEANGLARVLEVVLQIRGQAGKRQLKGVRRGLALSWRGIPTATGAVAVLGAKKI